MLNKAKSPFQKYRAFYDFVKADENIIELTIYDEIGFGGVTAKGIKADLESVSAKTIKVKINSPGGDVFDGVAIHNLLKDHPARIEVVVDGVAASAASIIAMAGDYITVADGAFVMIHNAWALTMGNADDHLKTIEALRKIDSALVGIYANRSGGNPEAIKRMMKDETWLNGAEAVQLGFADSTAQQPEKSAVSAAFDLSVFSNVPEKLRAHAPSPMPTNGDLTRKQLERTLRNAGLSKSAASRFASAGMRALTNSNAEARQRLKDLGNQIRIANSKLNA